MGSVKPEDVSAAKKKEAYIGAELYRVLKSSLTLIGRHPSNWVLQHVIPQYPVNDGKADLVVLGTLYRGMKPLLVVETKQRVYNRIGLSYANAAKQAKKYAKQLDCRYFAVYDGWILMLFDSVHPYLIGLYSASIETELDEQFAEELLVGLLDLNYSNKRDKLNALPKFRDVDFLRKKVLPSIAKMLAKEYVQELKEQNIEVDGEKERGELLKKWKDISST